MSSRSLFPRVWEFPALLGLALTVVSCSATLWDRPVARIQHDLQAGKTAFLSELTPEQLSKAAVSSLGPGAAWNLGCLLNSAGKPALAEQLWRRSVAEEPSPWRDRAALDLLDAYSQARDWGRAEDLAQRLLSFQPNNREYQRRLFETYYFQKKDTLAWALFQSWKVGDFSDDEERENELFRGVLLARSGQTAEASTVLRTLVFDRPASELQFRLQSFFAEDPHRVALIGADGQQALEFQGLVYLGSTVNLVAWMKKQTFSDDFWNHRALIENLETAFKASDRAEEGLRWLRRVGDPSDPGAHFAVVFTRGRLDRSLERWSDARREFQKALPLAVTDDDRQKTRWNWLNAWVEWQPERALSAFLQVYRETSDPGYYSDVFSDWMSRLVQDRRWTLLATVWRDLGDRLVADDRAALSFLLARLASHHLVDLGQAGLATTPDDLLRETMNSDPFSYEGLTAKAVLNQTLDWEASPVEPQFIADNEVRARNRVWDSMIAFGRAQELSTEVAASTEPLDPTWVERAVVRLQAQGQYRPSIKILYRLLKDPGRALTKARAMALYPLAFEALVKERAQAEGLDESLLLGLIREESTFDPSAKSWVGAVGLTQLMPATAAETAKRLRLKSFDLSDPRDNLVLGARYLKTMIRSQGSISLALMAYNAGGGRIRPWKKDLGQLPEELFVEAAPFAETRNYVKKIVASTVMIGALHYGTTPQQTIRMIYPSFSP